MMCFISSNRNDDSMKYEIYCYTKKSLYSPQSGKKIYVFLDSYELHEESYNLLIIHRRNNIILYDIIGNINSMILKFHSHKELKNYRDFTIKFTINLLKFFEKESIPNNLIKISNVLPEKEKIIFDQCCKKIIE